jgi:two-component system phosphate regulon sensor histidine kinase PhoR
MRRPAGDPPPARLDAEARARVLDALPVGILVVAPDLSLVHANAAAHRLLRDDKLLPGAQLEAETGVGSVAAAVLRRGAPLSSAADVAVGDMTVRVEGVRLPTERLAVLALEDVTRRVKRDRAEREFVANAAHELLGPVTGIVAAAQVLQGGAQDVPDARRRFVEHIAEAAERLTRTARALLVLQRAQSGEQPPRLELVPLRPLLDEVAGASRAAVVVHCPRDLAVLADRDLAAQALGTLIANARRHSPEGSIDVSVSEADTRTVAIEVQDAGGGILPEQLERVTERFFSGAGRDSGGFGLGLAIAAQAADAMGGSLELTSEPRRGTRACLRLASGKMVKQ